MALRLNRVKLGTYGDAKNARRRLEELEGAFEGELGWAFEREGLNREQIIWVYYPETDEKWKNHDEISCFIRKKSIKYRQEQRTLQAELAEQKANKNNA